MRNGVHQRDERPVACAPAGPPMTVLAPRTTGSSRDGACALTRASCRNSRQRRYPGGCVGGPPPPPPPGCCVGLADGEDDGECEGRIGGAVVGGGAMVVDTDGVGDGVDVVGAAVAVVVGAALLCCVPTCAGGGNRMTGAPASAWFIICCQAAAGRSPP